MSGSSAYLGVIAVALATLLPLHYTYAQADDTLTIESASTPAPAEIPTAASIYRTEQLLGDIVYGDFVVGPGKVEIELSPGQSGTAVLSISNRTGEEKIFTLETEDAKGTDDPNTPVLLIGDDVGPYSIKDYISIPATSFTVGHNQKVFVPVTVSLPANAAPGGRYGSVLITTTSIRDTQTQDGAPRSAIVSRIGTLFFVTTPGIENQEGALQDFSTIGQKKFYSGGPIPFGLLFENTGSVHLNPYGEIRVFNILNEEVGIIEIDPWFALPMSTRFREISFSREWLFGRYTAVANINRGYDNQIDSLSYTFWVINWIFLLKIFAGVIVVVFIIKTITSRFEFRRKE